MATIKLAITELNLRTLAEQGVRYLGVGLITFPVGASVAALAHKVLQLTEELAVALALIVLLMLGFPFKRRYTFRSKGHIGHQAWKFLLVAAAMRVSNTVCFLLRFLAFSINYLISLLLAIAISFTAKLFLYRTWIF